MIIVEQDEPGRMLGVGKLKAEKADRLVEGSLGFPRCALIGDDRTVRRKYVPFIG
jgi:hypothetical protein